MAEFPFVVSLKALPEDGLPEICKAAAKRPAEHQEERQTKKQNPSPQRYSQPTRQEQPIQQLKVRGELESGLAGARVLGPPSSLSPFSLPFSLSPSCLFPSSCSSSLLLSVRPPQPETGTPSKSDSQNPATSLKITKFSFLSNRGVPACYRTPRKLCREWARTLV